MYKWFPHPKLYQSCYTYTSTLHICSLEALCISSAMANRLQPSRGRGRPPMRGHCPIRVEGGRRRLIRARWSFSATPLCFPKPPLRPARAPSAVTGRPTSTTPRAHAAPAATICRPASSSCRLPATSRPPRMHSGPPVELAPPFRPRPPLDSYLHGRYLIKCPLGILVSIAIIPMLPKKKKVC
jgi:hypothetical protein